MKLPRWLHESWANFAGYFWLPCPLCGEYFGGHEWKVGSPNHSIMTSWNTGSGVCPNCHDAARAYNEKWMKDHTHKGVFANIEGGITMRATDAEDSAPSQTESNAETLSNSDGSAVPTRAVNASR